MDDPIRQQVVFSEPPKALAVWRSRLPNLRHYLGRLNWYRWPLFPRLALAISLTVIITTLSLILLSIQRERQSFRLELEQQAASILGTLAAAGSDALYSLDSNGLETIAERVVRYNEELLNIRFYDANGRVLAAPDAPDLQRRIESDPYGTWLTARDSFDPIFDWSDDRLTAGQPVFVGRQVIGAVSLELSTAALNETLASLETQGLIAGSAAMVIGILLALIISRSVTGPIHELAGITQRIAGGELEQVIDRREGNDEITLLSNALDGMRSDLHRLYTSLEQQVTERTRELIQARDQALEASRFKTQLLAKVSHELRTPLGAIMGYTELLQNGMFGSLSPEQKNVTAEVIDSTDYLTKLVNQLLDQAQNESAAIRLHVTAFELAALLHQVETQMSVLTRNKGLLFTTELADDLPPLLFGDRDRLQQILVNLVGNAIKFTDSGQIGVRLFRLGATHWGIQVSDTGMGIPQEAQAYIFEPFRQVDGSLTRQYGGTGLGLTIVQQLVQLMDGEIKLESENGRGTVFTILLPLQVAQESVIDTINQPEWKSAGAKRE
jgi:signal transduction histidine kinase